MTKRKFTAALVALFCFAPCFAQTDSVQTKRTDNFVGIQVNELIKQIFSLSTDNSVIDNPYLLKHTLFFGKKKAWGIHSGIGYRYQNIKAEDTNNQSNINDVFYRVGAVRKSMIGKRIEVGYGLDYAGEYHGSVTESSSSVDFNNTIDSTFTKITSKATGVGGGLYLDIGFYITPRLMLGTETNYYFLKLKEKENVLIAETIINKTTGFTTASISNFNDETMSSEFAITVPVAIFLIVKF